MDKPSVTTVLRKAREFTGIPEAVLEKARERGSRVHEMIPKLIYPKQEAYTVDADIAGYLKSFSDWYRIAVQETLFCEKEIVCDCYGYIGHLDWAGVLKGDGKDVTIIDWKTPLLSHLVFKCQTAAYVHLVDKHLILPPGYKAKRSATLHLDPTGGKAKLSEASELTLYYFNGFLTALYFHKFFSQETKKEEIENGRA